MAYQDSLSPFPTSGEGRSGAGQWLGWRHSGDPDLGLGEDAFCQGALSDQLRGSLSRHKALTGGTLVEPLPPSTEGN